jgi:hypothetical protein
MGIADCGMRNEKSGIKNWLADFGFADSPPRWATKKVMCGQGKICLTEGFMVL